MANKQTSEKTRPGTFQPGHQVNAKSNKPKGRFITQQLIRMLHEDIKDFDPKLATPEDVRNRTKVIYKFCKKLISLALEGDTTAIKLVMDRIEGTAIATMQFRDIPEGEETPEQLAAMQLTRDKIASMTPDERIGLYRASLTEAGRTLGSA